VPKVGDVEIVLHGKAVAVREGGAVSATTYPTVAAARKAYEKLLAANRGDDEPGPPADNEELLAQIAKAPGDDALRMVYADWLQANGNPRGELIALQANPKLQAKAKRLIDKHPEWLGALGERMQSLLKWDAKTIRLEWRLGFLDKIELRSASVDADLVGQITKLDSARFVRELVLGGSDMYRKVVTVLGKTGWPAHVERLSIGHQRWGEYLHTPNQCGDLVAAIKKYPRLVELDITPGNSKLGGIVAPGVRRLTLRDVTPHQLLAVAAAKWPVLERLGLRLIETRYIATALNLKLVAPKLRELEIHLWRDDQLEAFVEAAPKAKLLAVIDRLHVIGDKAYVKAVQAALPKLAVVDADDEAELG
jgi:uncharacterized protein (TIGR02996 family)